MLPDLTRIFLLSHMRAYTSLIGHILGSHPQINGYYEMHLGYTNARDLLHQEQEYTRHDALKPGSRFLFDKLLHNDYGLNPRLPELQDAVLLLALRRPEPTLKSIIKLFRGKGTNDPYSYPAEAVLYYIGRLETLAAFARVSPERYYYFDSEQVCNNTENLLHHLAVWLQLDSPLPERYQRFAKTGVAGAGDTSATINSGTIIKNTRENFNGITLDDGLFRQAEHTYQECRQQLIHNAIAFCVYPNN